MVHAESVPAQRFSDHQLAALDARLDGDIVHCRHPEYQQARRIWNAMIDRHPRWSSVAGPTAMSAPQSNSPVSTPSG